MNKERIKQEYINTFEKAFKMYSIRFDIPQLLFTESGTFGGKAIKRTKNGVVTRQCVFNTILAKNAGDSFLNTIQHEVSHQIQYELYPRSSAHGKEFQSIHKALGGNGARCHNYDTTGCKGLQKRWKYACGCKTFELTTTRHNKNKKMLALYNRPMYTCKLCRQPLIIKGD